MIRPSFLLAVAIAILAAAPASAALGPAALVPSPVQLFQRADTNHDGIVTRAEFAASRAQRFRELDRNHDGYLTLDDLPAPVHAARGGAPRLREALGVFDTDHDGRVSLDEFIAGSLRVFDQADTARTGAISLEQFARIIDTLRAGMGR